MKDQGFAARQIVHLLDSLERRAGEADRLRETSIVQQPSSAVRCAIPSIVSRRAGL
jgi:hypothetical protein